MKTKIISLFFALVLTLSACGGSTFQQNQDKWEGQGINHYRFTVVLGCFCPFAGAEVTYEVKDGQVVNETVKAASDRPDDPGRISEFYQPFNTIEKVFEYVSKSMNEADETTIEYDSTYGFPTSISVDWIKLAIDDEMYLTLSNFEALP
jgi:outer membrane lipoprotein-sorting protein